METVGQPNKLFVFFFLSYPADDQINENEARFYTEIFLRYLPKDQPPIKAKTVS